MEVKAVQALTPLCAAQLITYLKLKGCAVGLLLNFNVSVMRHGVRRFANRSADSLGEPTCVDDVPTT
jgi:GxxExxY protein